MGRTGFRCHLQTGLTAQRACSAFPWSTIGVVDLSGGAK